MSKYLTFPKQAEYGKNIPKSKIYLHSSSNTKIKSYFTKEIDKIIWSYKLSPETINISAKEEVQEIQVFTIYLKTGEFHAEVLAAIDKAIPSPIIFRILYEDKIKFVGAYKRPHVLDLKKWIISDYFETPWQSTKNDTMQLPLSLNLKALYHLLLEELIELKRNKDENFSDFTQRISRLKQAEREANLIKSKLNKEKQFNKKIEINNNLNQLKAEIEDLKGNCK